MIPTPHSDLNVGQGTHPGETGKNNEDRFGVSSFYGEGGEQVTLAVIADGIGGNQAGEVASDLAVKTISRSVGKSAGMDYAAILDAAMRQTAGAVVEAAKARPDLRGMGTTCVAALLAGRRLYTAYIGDSRAYLARRGGILQTTVDHTFVQEAIEHGLLTPAEAKTHPHRHVVRRHLGADPNVRADFRLRLSETEPPETSMRNQGMLRINNQQGTFFIEKLALDATGLGSQVGVEAIGSMPLVMMFSSPFPLAPVTWNVK